MSKQLTPLKALERIKNAPTIYVGCASDVYTRYSHECKIIETALKEYELMKEIRITARFDLAQVNKEHKALEIIKEKKVDADEIYHKDYEWYLLDHKNDDKSLILTKEEFDLLKEVLL